MKWKTTNISLRKECTLIQVLFIANIKNVTFSWFLLKRQLLTSTTNAYYTNGIIGQWHIHEYMYISCFLDYFNIWRIKCIKVVISYLIMVMSRYKARWSLENLLSFKFMSLSDGSVVDASNLFPWTDCIGPIGSQQPTSVGYGLLSVNTFFMIVIPA